MNWFDNTKQYLKKITIINCILQLIQIPFGLFNAKVTSYIVTGAIAGNINNVLISSAILLGTVIVLRIFNVAVNIKISGISSNALHKCKLDLYRQFLSNPLNLLYTSKHGESIEKLNDDFGVVVGLRTSVYPNLITQSITAVTYFIFLSFHNIWIALSFLFVGVLQIFPPIIVKKYLQINYDNNRDIEAQIAEFTMEGYRGFTEIKLYNLKKWWIGKLNTLQKKYIKIGIRAETTCCADDIITNLVSNIVRYGIYAVCGVFVLLKYIDVSICVQAIALSGGFLGAISSIFSSISDFAVVKRAKERIGEWCNKSNVCNDVIETTDIALSNVVFSYDERLILNKETIVFDCTKKLLIKGANGIGKSTLFRLITGLCSADDGCITVGMTNVSHLSEKNFPRRLFYLPQDDAVFDFTAYELYQMMIPEQIDEVIELTREFLLSPNLIMDSKISDLSGGERKKVYLALAFVINPKIILLDEPTNSLDFESKNTLVRLLGKSEGGVIIISHEDIFDNIVDYSYIFSSGGINIEKAK